jgi:hypothetical protein
LSAAAASLALVCAAGAAPLVATAGAPANASASADLSARALAYFVEQAHPTTGLVRDRAKNFGPTPDDTTYRRASIAATGFGLAALAHAAKCGRLDAARAEAAILRALDTALALPHFHGWLYHFVDWETGARFPKSEVSTIDTTWLLAGALYAGAVSRDPRIAARADALYRRVDFEAMRTDLGAHPDKPTLSMGWLPESGFITTQWDAYAEEMLLVLLGLGHPTSPLAPAAWRAFARPATRLPDGQTLIGAELPLFAHQYSQLFVDFRGRDDGFGDYAKNTAIATLRDRAYARAAAVARATFAAGFWGISASDGPNGYAAYTLATEDGTVCLNCAGASAAFVPDVVLADLAAWEASPFAPRILGRYGFADAVNLDRAPPYIDEDVVGITVGALYLGLVDADPSTALWADFDAIPAIRRGLDVAFGTPR